MPFAAARASFLKVPIINGPRKARFVVYFQDKGFNSFQDNIIKLSVNIAKLRVCSLKPTLVHSLDVNFEFVNSCPKS